MLSLRDRDITVAAAAAYALVAKADGRLQPEEIAKVIDCLQKGADVLRLDAEAAKKLFMKNVDKLESYRDYDAEKRKLMNEITKIKGNPTKMRFIVEACLDIAKAADGYDQFEKRIIFDVCRVLGVDPQEHGF